MSDVISELIMRISELEKRVANICRLAKVTYVYRKSGDPGQGAQDPGNTDIGYVDVEFEGLPVSKIPFLTMRHGEDKTFWLPSVDEVGLLFSPSGDLANAMFLPAFVYKGFPAHIPDGISVHKCKRIFRDGMEEEIDVDSHSHQFTSDNSNRFIDREKIEDTQGTSTIKIDGDETEIKRAAGKIAEIVGTNKNELTTILMNLIGAHFFPTGITTLQSPAGPVMFAPAASPATAPSPPAGSSPDANGKATKIPATRTNGITVHGKRLSMTFTLPSIVVTTPAGPGSTTPTPLTLTFTIGSGELDLTFPAKTL